MEQLPYIDEHAMEIGADRERTWEAVLSVVRRDLGGGAPAPFMKLLDVTPATAAGDWNGSLDGAALPGFAVAEAVRPSRLELRGRHRFSRYALIIELDEAGDGRSRVRAQTWAAFPGVRGRIYRALVIGSGGHKLVVKRLLRRVEQRA